MRRLLPLFVGAALLAGAAPAASQDTPSEVEIREWEVPWPDTRPRDPYVGPEGGIWFVGQRADYVAVLDPGTGEFQRFDLPEGAGPHNLIVSGDGTIWYAGNRDRHIGRLDPATGEVARIDMPDPGARDPHTLLFGEGDRIYFTVQGGNRVGRLDAGTGEVTLREVPTEGARPYGIVRAPDGTVWVAEFGTHKLLRVDPEAMAIEEVPLPRTEARPRRLQPTSDGRIWYGDYAGGYLGAYDPATGEFEEWPLPRGGEARPYAMAVDARDRLWVVETGPRGEPNRLVGFDPGDETFFSITPIPSGGGTVRHMVYHEPTSTIWFGTDANTVGRARIP
jgi:virginiamycin B lyase